MAAYVDYVFHKYFGVKGQGLTEYAIILLLVVLIGVTLFSTSSLKAQITGLYTTITTDLSGVGATKP